MRLLGSVSLFALAHSYSALAATADQWRSRSIYQVIIDRFALPAGADPNACDPGNQTWCGGTWQTLRTKLDYIQDAGFTAVWISPVSQNYEGPRTAYGDAYHGYWIADVSQLNARFGSADDLKALSDDLHSRGMYLMVDVVVNDVMSTSQNPDYSTYMLKNESQYHPYCPVDYTNTTSEEICWLGDTKVYLPDVKTEDPTVVSAYSDWIAQLVQDYNIDGLRIDAAKHVDMPFWPSFCGAAGVFCIGEVFDGDVPSVAEWQGPEAMDSVLNYPTYTALVDAFTIPGPGNISALVDTISQSKTLFHDPTVLGNFLEDQDVPRWSNLSVDPQSKYNAMVYNFMSDGIPIVYYGQEQGFSGNADPWNREPMWPSGYANTTTYTLMTNLNKLRNWLINGTSNWLTTPMQVLSSTDNSIAIMKGDVVTFMTNIGSPPQDVTIFAYTPFDAVMPVTDILSCNQHITGSNGTLIMDYSNTGGVPTVLIPDSLLTGSGFCGHNEAAAPQGHAQATNTGLLASRPGSTVFTLLVAALVYCGFMVL